VAFAADHARVELPPFTTVFGFALRATVGDGDATDTVADCAAWPPAPTHVNV